MDIDKITKRISGKCVSRIEAREGEHLAIVFIDGSFVLVKRMGEVLAVEFGAEDGKSVCPVFLRPTLRQGEYLEFIRKYMLRFGISPAESDIQRHFLVSAPSVNSMVQALERLGFIVRQPGVPRSIRLVDVTDCAICGGTHHLKTAKGRGIARR